MEGFWENIISFVILGLKVFAALFFIEACFYFFEFDIHIPFVEGAVKYAVHILQIM